MSTLLDEAMTHHRSGRLDAAEQGYRSLLVAEPDQPDALHLLGVALCQQGRALEALPWIEEAIRRRPEIAAYHAARGEVLRELGRHVEAAAALAKALELDPALASAHNNLGLVRLSQGQADRALASFDEAIRLRPGFTTAQINRGEALQALGRFEEAAAAYERELEREPENAWVHTYLGHVLVELGDVDRLAEAAAHCRRAIELAPGLGHAHCNLGNAWSAMGRHEEALAAYRRAIDLDPTLSLPWNNIGRVEQQLNRFDAALAAYERALAMEPRAARFRTNLAHLLAEQDRTTAALEHYRIALECDPNYAEAHHGLAAVFGILGRRAEARAALEHAIRLRPRMPAPRIALARMLAEDGEFERSHAQARDLLADFPKFADVYSLLALNLRARLPDADLEAMTALLDHPYFDDGTRAGLAFGIATVLDGRGRYEEAARFYEVANAQQAAARAQRGQTFDLDRIVRNVDETIACFTPEFFRAIQGLGSPSTRPIFIVGMPRSGTTLTEQILASHPSVFGAGELDDVGRLARELAGEALKPSDLARALRSRDRASIQALADRYLARLEELDRPAAHVVDKMPGNYFHLGLIAALWPEARIILCRRDPRDVAFSCWATFFGELRWANDLRVIAQQIIQHDRLIAHWRAVLPIPVIEVVYEELVTDFEPQARRLVESVGLAWHPDCRDFHTLSRPIRTASFGQVRQPIYSRSVGRWKHYEAALAPVLETFACQDHPLPS
jgi:tetratricopeptide (TPR) repeat protein